MSCSRPGHSTSRSPATIASGVTGATRDSSSSRRSATRAFGIWCAPRRPSGMRPYSRAGVRMVTTVRKRRRLDGPAVDGEAFFKMDQVRGRVASHPQASGAKTVIHHCGDRAFAVGARNQHAAERVLRLAEARAHRPDIRETELDPEL